MAVHIDSKALVNPGACIGDGVRIGPYTVVEKNVKIGADSVIDSFAQLLGRTTIGSNCHVFPYASIGNVPQDLKYTGEISFLDIGNNNCIREFVTMNPGTKKNSRTVVGNNNLIMAYSHVAHDCQIGDGNILANSTTLAGHVKIEDKAVIGGLVAVHQFCRIGELSIVGGCSKVVQDVPPYSMCDGHPACVYGLNSIGLKRAKISFEQVRILKKAFKELFFQNRLLSDAKQTIVQELPRSTEIDHLLKFVSESKRGISRQVSKRI